MLERQRWRNEEDSARERNIEDEGESREDLQDGVIERKVAGVMVKREEVEDEEWLERKSRKDKGVELQERK